jgi:hypothetical protein
MNAGRDSSWTMAVVRDERRWTESGGDGLMELLPQLRQSLERRPTWLQQRVVLLD